MYGHVISKFCRMGSLPHFLSHGAPLRALGARKLRCQNWPTKLFILEEQGHLSQERPSVLMRCICTPICNRPSDIYFLTRFSGKTSPLSVRSMFCLFQPHTNDKCSVCKSRAGEATNWPGKISSDTREAKFSLGEGKQSIRSGFTGSVTEGCIC